ncbi:hypothetical protein [Streptomyces mirabilis]|uniref:hypothetical protein n=1 Tax=Streptomyces mirabilis TaxID=68239 RepID=UPI0015A637BD|nr:hypothetical protein [Streptomyces mirabilis]
MAAGHSTDPARRRIDCGDHVGFLLAPEAAENLAGDRITLLSLNDTLDIIPGHPAN